MDWRGSSGSMENRSHFREAKSFASASRTLGSPFSESNFFSHRDLFNRSVTFCAFWSRFVSLIWEYRADPVGQRWCAWWGLAPNALSVLSQESTQRNSALGLLNHVEVLTAGALICIHSGSTHHIDGVEGTPNRKPPHLSVFACALPLSRSLQLSFILRILLAQAHTFKVVERTGHRRFSSVSLTMSTAKLVPSRSVGFRTYLAIVTGGFCTCLAIVPVSAAVFHVRMLHCTGQGVSEANDQRSAQRSVRSVGISDRSVGDLRSTGRKVWKKLDAAGRFERFFSLSLERERSAGEMVRRCRYAAPSVLDRHQKFCESAARLDGYVEFKWRPNGERATDRARIKVLWTH